MSDNSPSFNSTGFYQSFYSDQSSIHKLVKWRMLSAFYKARNVIKLLSDIPVCSHVLEVGSGTGELAHHLHSTHKYPPIHISDVSQAALSYANSNYPSSIASSTLLVPNAPLPFQNDQFDLVICSHVLEHVPNPTFLLKELLRVSKLVFLEVPLDFRYYRIPTEQLLKCGHIHAFSASTIRFYIEQTESHILNQGFSFTQHSYDLSLFPILHEKSRSLTLRLFTSLISSTLRWLIVGIKLRVRSLFGNPGTEAFYLLSRSL